MPRRARRSSRPSRDRLYAALPTEAAWSAAADLDALSADEIVRLMTRREARSLAAVHRAAPAIARVARAAAAALAAGGRLVYVGAGTSGRLGALDASECPPTFGARPGQVVAIIAGGRRALTRAVEGAEDDDRAGAAAIVRARVSRRDCVVGLTASGVTPFVLAALERARAAGATTALVTCAGRARRPLISRLITPGLFVGLDVGPEILAGSTRLGAGTAQKLTLNAISTAAMTLTGHAYGPRMVNVRTGSAKLRARARRLVEELTDRRGAAAQALLRAAGGDVKLAVVMARLDLSRAAAQRALARAGGQLRALLGRPPRPRSRAPRHA